MGERADGERHRGPRTPRYRAWLLRRWAGPGEPPGAGWRYSLEDPHTGARRRFASLVALVAYLQAEPGEDVVAPRPAGEPPGDPNDAGPRIAEGECRANHEEPGRLVAPDRATPAQLNHLATARMAAE